MPLNELLSRPLIKIYQDPDHFNFSLDSVILSDFANLKNTDTILDIGTGNAAIALFLAFKKPCLRISAIEIQESSYNMALDNIELNKVRNIDLILGDVRNFNFNKKFDHIISNPPFFKVGNNNLNPNLKKQIARHEVMLTFPELCDSASRLLNDYGKFTLIHRPDRLDELLMTLTKYNLTPMRLRFVHPFLGEKAKHVLIEAVKAKKQGSLQILPPLIIRLNGVLSDEIKAIYYGRDFDEETN